MWFLRFYRIYTGLSSLFNKISLRIEIQCLYCFDTHLTQWSWLFGCHFVDCNLMRNSLIFWFEQIFSGRHKRKTARWIHFRNKFLLKTIICHICYEIAAYTDAVIWSSEFKIFKKCGYLCFVSIFAPTRFDNLWENRALFSYDTFGCNSLNLH